METSPTPPVPGATPLLGPEALREADRRATEDLGIASILLMERAGHGAADEILRRYPDARAATILVGPGNNGGDGMVVARLLSAAGWRVRALSRDGEPPGTPDGQAMARAARGFGVDIDAFRLGDTADPGDVVVDALLGTGATGALKGPIQAMCRWANDACVPVVALDVPSGVSAETGEADPGAVRADVTVTFHADTVGLRVHPGRGLAGDVVVASIGAPPGHADAASAWLIDIAAVAAVPPKGSGDDKYASGAVLVVGGSRGMSGAARLASHAALRAGAGLCVAAVPGDVADLVAQGAAEVMVEPLDGATHVVPADVGRILAQAARVSALAIGPGLGRHPDTGEAVRDLLARTDLPVVVDADGLWHMVGHPDVVRNRAGATVLTPHTGEAARLLETPRERVDAARLDAARTLAQRFGCTVVLKGPGTLVQDPGRAPLVCGPGGPELATAGSGDVLTGVVTAFLARGVPPETAAAAAVAVHARAGERAGHGDGTLAGDVADALPGAVRDGRRAARAAASPARRERGGRG